MENILIRMPNWLGDLVMATPIIHDIRAHFKDAKITAQVPNGLAPLLIDNPHLDEIFAFSRPNIFLKKEESRDVAYKMIQGKYDLGILLTNSFSSAWLFYRGKVKKRVGFTGNWRRPLLTQAVPCPKEKGKEHLVTTYKRLLLPLGIPISQTAPELFIKDEERKHIRMLLRELGVPQEKRQLIGINAGAAFGPAKCWPTERFRAAALKLLERQDRYLLFFGDKSQGPMVQEIMKGMPSRAINLAGRTSLRELMGFLEAVDVLLTNDSGPMHLAAALKTPLVALFGSTNEVATGPYKHGTVIHKHVECSPCYLRTCPIDFRCMKRIEVDEVVKELEALL